MAGEAAGIPCVLHLLQAPPPSAAGRGRLVPALCPQLRPQTRRAAAPCASAPAQCSLSPLSWSWTPRAGLLLGLRRLGRLGHAEQKDRDGPRLVKLFRLAGRGRQIYAGYTCSFAVSEVGQ